MRRLGAILECTLAGSANVWNFLPAGVTGLRGLVATGGRSSPDRDRAVRRCRRMDVNAGEAMVDFWFGSSQCAQPLRTWSRVNEAVGEAFCASAKAVLRKQAELARDWAERVAVDSRSSKLTVEGAHQAYDLVVAYTEASAQWCETWLAMLRSIDPQQAASRRPAPGQEPGAALTELPE